jgi:membrane-bound serine protease (ClpP class)
MWEWPISLLLAVLAAGKIVFLFLCWQVWRTYQRGFLPGQSRMIGLTGKALTDIEREGRVMVQGEYWWARARTSILAGESVRVTGIDGMMLEVEPSPDKTMIPRPVSAVLPAEPTNH